MKAQVTVEEAIDAARIDGDLRPLNTVLGFMIRKARNVDVEELLDVRSRVYVALSGLFAKGRPSSEIAKQLKTIVFRQAINEYRAQTKYRKDESFETALEDTVFDRTATTTEEIVFSHEEVSELRLKLNELRDSSKDSDRKYYVALDAWARGQSVHQALLESDPTITPNNASKTLGRAKERLKAVYLASEGEKVS